MKKSKLTIILCIVLCLSISIGKAQIGIMVKPKNTPPIEIKIPLMTMVYDSYVNQNSSFNNKAQAEKCCEHIKNNVKNVSDQILNVVILDEQSKEGQTLISVFEKYWTYSKYKFISIDEFKATYADTGSFYFLPTTIDPPANTPFYSANPCFVILKSGKGISISKKNKISFNIKKSLVYGVDYSYTFSDSDAVYYPLYLSGFNSILSNLQNESCEIEKKKDNKKSGFYNNITIDSLKGKTLVIDNSFAEYIASFSKKKDNCEDEFKSSYSKTLGIPQENIIFLEKEDLNKLFEAGNKNYIYLLKNSEIYDYKGLRVM